MKRENKLVIINATIITPYRLIYNGYIDIHEGKIAAVGEGVSQYIEGAVVIDAKGLFVAPGFIDLHVHGGGGADFMDATREAFACIRRTHAQFGTTSMLATSLTSSKEELFNLLEVYRAAKDEEVNGAALIGLHLEGPYFAMEQRGAQDPRYIRDPHPEEYLAVLDASDDIKRWSAAPERVGALDFGRAMQQRRVIASIAHTNALHSDVLQAIENGYTLMTHFYSAMLGVTRIDAYRHMGAIESAYLIDELDVEIIADGAHLPPELIKLIYKQKGPDRIALITDAMRGAAMPEGRSVLGSLKDGVEVFVEGGVAKMPDRSSFAGSVATFDRLVCTVVKEANIPIMDAVYMASTVPARIMGLSTSKGTIAVGKDADLVIFDADIAVQYTVVGGQLMYEKTSSKK